MKKIISLMLLVSGFTACAGGGIDANSVNGASSQFDSNAIVQALPYEQVRNNLIKAFGLVPGSKALEKLDANALTFGAAVAPGAPRKLDLSLTRLRTYTQVCDLAVSEGMKNIPDQLFGTANPLDGSTICRRILGRPITDSHRAAIEKLLALQGYQSVIQKQHVIGVACCSMLEAQVQ